jgi:hypothetical protein
MEESAAIMASSKTVGHVGNCIAAYADDVEKIGSGFDASNKQEGKMPVCLIKRSK